MIADSYRQHAHSLWSVLFRIEGNILIAVLPFCVVNCLLLGLVAYFRERQQFGFSANGHGLLTLLISFLVISKVNLAYDRFRAVRSSASSAFLHLRELMQLVISVSTSNSISCSTGSTNTTNFSNDENNNNNERERELRYWRMECVSKVSNVMDATVLAMKDRNLACHIARNEPLKTYPRSTRSDVGEQQQHDASEIDPMVQIQFLRMHLYCSTDLDIHLLERVTLVNKLQDFVTSYNTLLVLASTPLPFPLVQMGRAFLFVWTFTMPLVLLDGPFNDVWTAQAFLFFLTYGFIGLELVSIKLSDPFGDGRDDAQISKIRDATMEGIENDLKGIQMQMTLSERRMQFSKQKHRQPWKQTQAQCGDGSLRAPFGRDGYGDHDHHNNHDYHMMGGNDVDMGC